MHMYMHVYIHTYIYIYVYVYVYIYIYRYIGASPEMATHRSPEPLGPPLLALLSGHTFRPQCRSVAYLEIGTTSPGLELDSRMREAARMTHTGFIVLHKTI